MLSNCLCMFWSYYLSYVATDFDFELYKTLISCMCLFIFLHHWLILSVKSNVSIFFVSLAGMILGYIWHFKDDRLWHYFGMDWLSPHNVILDIYVMTLTLTRPGVPRFEWTGNSGSYPWKVISFIRAQRFVDIWSFSYFAFIQDTRFEPFPMEYVLVVFEVVDVFPTYHW